MSTKALFLDRDGVINVNYGYVHKRENFDFIDGIFDVAKHAQSMNYKIIVITNQAGIGRGIYSEDDYYQLTEWMCKKFSETGTLISRVYFSPFHPTSGLGKYLRDHISRKPRPGMILQARADFGIDLSRSVLIGDSATDIMAGSVAGIRINLLLSQQSPESLEGYNYKRIRNLSEAIKFL